MLMQS
jgi:hypothetical protein